MKYLLSALLSITIIVLSGQSVLAQNTQKNNIIADKSALIKKGLNFDPYQHPGLILLNDEEKHYSLKSKSIKTSVPSLNNLSIKQIAKDFSSDAIPPISATTAASGENTQITFLVINDTKKNLWTLDLANSTFLPVTNYKKVEIFNIIDGRKLATLNNNQEKQILSLKPGKPYLITVSLNEPSHKLGRHSFELYAYGSVHDTASMSYMELFFKVTSISILI